MLCLLGDEVAVYVLPIGGCNPSAHMFDLTYMKGSERESQRLLPASSARICLTYMKGREREPKASPSLFSKNMFDLYDGLTERAKGLSQPLQHEYV